MKLVLVASCFETHTTIMSSCILSNCFLLCLLEDITTSSGTITATNATSKVNTATPITAHVSSEPLLGELAPTAAVEVQ